ncbi:MAG: TonB-dependent receptor domain-containing protein [bacterium]
MSRRQKATPVGQWLRAGLTLGLLFSLGLCTVFAQTAILRGKVTDAQSGEALPQANVQVTATGVQTGAASNLDGEYEVPNLAAGTYSITVSYVGYDRKVIANVTVAAGENKVLNITLTGTGVTLNPVVVSASRRQEKSLDAPAAVSVLEATQIRGRPATTPTDYLRGLPAVDVSTNGIAQSNVVVRGFNNIFSGALLSLTDNRYANVPSLRLNAYNFIPLTTEDISRIEVVSGPGAALYGPNSAGGVMHIITKSPFDSEGLTLSVGGGGRDFMNFARSDPSGGRNIYMASGRYAKGLSEKVGLKISAQYYEGRDWESFDRLEPATITKYTQTSTGNVPQGGPVPNTRDFNVQKISGEARLDFRLTDDTGLIFNAGYNRANNLELTGLGAGQADGWAYLYGQARFNYKDFFIQGFVNASDAGDTYLLRDGALIKDNSKLFAAQVQHSLGLGTKQRFIYGIDAILTRPDTKSTINGRNEGNDNINEYGVYLQSETKLSPKLDVLLAARIDDHNFIEDPVFSPRAALVFKPNSNNTLRATYNRAFSTPTSNNLFLDLSSAQDVFGLGRAFGNPAFGTSVRAQGVPGTGFNFNIGANGLPQFRSPFAVQAGLSSSTFINQNDPLFTNVMWGVGRQAVLAQFVPAFQAGLRAQGLPEANIQAITAAFLGIVPQQLAGLTNVMRVLNTTTRTFSQVTAVKNVPRIQETTHETFELGYKGVIAKKLFVGVDLYHSKIKDFVGPLKVETPNVFLDPTPLGGALGTQFGTALANPANAQLNAILIASLDPAARGGNGNGTAVDELVRLFATGAAGIPFGTVGPKEAFDPTALILTYRNFGDVSLNGMDMYFSYYAGTNWMFSGNYSFVTKSGFNFFKKPNRVLYRNLGGVADISLNAPANKFALAVQYRAPQRGYEVELRGRYVEGFPQDSGVYIGEVQTYTVFDFNFGYDLPFSSGTRFSIAASNILDNKHLEFVGAPVLGRLIMTRLTQTF